MILLLLIAVNMQAQTVRRLDDATVNALNSTIASEFNSHNLKGLSVGVIYGGEIVYTNAWGNATNIPPFTTETKTVIASVSKTITAVMAMRMVQNGDIALNDPITDYVPFTGGNNITIRHLLCHQSGIGHYENCPGGYDGQFNWSSSLFTVLGCTRCVTPPGSATLYTTFGTTLLGSIIEKVGLDVYGRNYRQLYNDWIGVSELTPEFDDSDPELANGYTQGNSALSRGWSDIGWRLPAGGFIADIGALTNFGRGVIRNSYISATTAAQMRVVQTTSGSANVTCGDTGGSYGLGFQVSGSGDDIRLSHTGLNNHGYSSFIYLYPLKGVGIILLCNNDDQADALSDIRSAIADMVVCPDDRDFTNTINWAAPLIYEADRDISVSVPMTSSGVILDGGRSVILKPGFEVTAGKEFRAVAEGCMGAIKSY